MTTSAAPPDRGLRGNRDFLLLWTGTALSYLGSQVSLYAYPLIVLWATGSPAAAGLIGFAANLPYLVVQLPAGIVVDRWDRRRLLILCDTGKLLVVGTVPVVVLLDGLHLPHLAAVAFVEGSLTVVYRIAERSALPSVVPARHLATALSRNEARERAAGLLGQPGAGILVTVAQWAPFLSTAVMHALSLTTVLMIRGKLQEDGVREPQSPLAALTEGLRWMWRHKFARVAAGLIAVSNLCFQVLLLVVLVIVRDGGGSPAVAALVYTVAGVGGMLGALGALRCIRRFSLPALVIGANAVWALVVPFVAFVREPAVLGALFATIAFVGAVWTVAVSAYLVRIVPDDLRGRVTSVAILLAYGPLAFGSALGGLALSMLGVPGTVLAVSVVLGLLAIVAAANPTVRGVAEPAR